MNRHAKFALAGMLTLAPACSALAQTYRDTSGTVVPGVVVVDPTDNSGPLGTSSNPMKISGSFSATLRGFQPTPSYSQLSITSASASFSVALPSGTVVIVYNTGSNDAYMKLGNSTVTAAASNDVVKAGGWMAFTVGSNTFIAGFATGGTTSLNISGGTGLPTGSGGGSGGGAGGTITTTPKTAAFSAPGCIVGTASAQCLAASTAVNHIQIQNASASASIACAFGATAALSSSGSIQLAPGQSALWGPSTSGVPFGALNCIAGAASTPLYLEYN
jgi:hypothetical protein